MAWAASLPSSNTAVPDVLSRNDSAFPTGSRATRSALTRGESSSNSQMPKPRKSAHIPPYIHVTQTRARGFRVGALGWAYFSAYQFSTPE